MIFREEFFRWVYIKTIVYDKRDCTIFPLATVDALISFIIFFNKIIKKETTVKTIV